MKMTGALVVEVLLAGAMSFIWILLLVVRIIEPTPEQIKSAFQFVSSASAIFFTLFAGTSYVLGWAISFLAESLMDPLFQSRYRDKYYSSLGLNFFDVRSRVFNNCPDHVIKDIEYDRQLIRIARSNSLNFTMISLVVFSFVSVSEIATKLKFTISALSLIFSILSFCQWRFRYKSTFAKFFDLYRELITNEDFNNGNIKLPIAKEEKGRNKGKSKAKKRKK